MSGPYIRLTLPPDGSFFLLGLRGVGKSTWARSLFGEAHFVDLLDERVFNDLLVQPALFSAELAARPDAREVVIDEVQRIPALLNEVHRAIERRRLRFVLLGSSARKLKTAGTNLLAGRAVLKTMYPLTPAELGKDFHLEEVLRYGSLPLIWAAPDRAAALEAYVHLYLREEIRAEALVRSLPAFTRFLPIAALFHGQVINVSGIAREAAVARTTVNGYLEILEDTLLTYRLPAYEARLRLRERKHPKLYWADTGLVRAARRQSGPVGPEERGALLEGWVLTLLRAHGEEAELYDEISYWAPAQGSNVEVDYLLRRRNELLAVEVKSSERFSTGLLKGLKAVAELSGLVRRILVYRGERSLRTEDGIDVWPVARLASEIARGTLWP